MSDNKSIAVILGTVVGIAAAAAVALYVCRCHEPAVKDVNEIFDEARRTVQELHRNIEALRRSVA